MKEKIIEILKTELDPTIRFEVLEKFYHQVSSDEDINLIIDILKNDADPCVRHEAAAQLFRIEEKKNSLMKNLKRKAISVLFDRACHDESTVVRHEAIEALGYIVENEDLNNLYAFTDSTNNDIKSTAYIAYNAAKQRIENNLQPKELSNHLINSWKKNTVVTSFK